MDLKAKNKINKSNIDPKEVSRKWKLASDLFDLAFRTKKFQLQKKNPKLSEEEVKKKAYALIEKGCSWQLF